MSVIIYPNPACGTSRDTLALIRATGTAPQVVEYLATPPSRDELVSLIERMVSRPVNCCVRRGRLIKNSHTVIRAWTTTGSSTR